MIVGVALFASHAFRSPPVIDQELVFAIAESQGHLSPEATRKLREQVARTQTDLDALRQQYPDWASEIDRAINAFNESDIEGARSAFEEIDHLITERRADLRLEQARSKHAQATLLYPSRLSQSGPLLCDAAQLAESNVWYWVDCGRAQEALGSLNAAMAAFQSASDSAGQTGALHDNAVVLVEIGDVRLEQGQLDAALDAFTESLDIRRDLVAQSPSNANWAFGLSASLDRVGTVQREQGQLDAAF
ncbi:MAG: hypothetical protein ABJJ69_18680, partial [Paracoccaceae bacterium]